MAKLKKKIVQTALFVSQFWTIQKITPKSALLSLMTLARSINRIPRKAKGKMKNIVSKMNGF